jgi:hypothetical protein
MSEEMILIAELEALGLYGPARCTCLDDVPCYPGRRSAFCIFCEVVEEWKEKKVVLV